MTNVYSRRLFLSALGVLPLAAAGFWDQKKYTEWTAEEVEKLLADSPWSKPITATFHAEGRRGPGGSGGMRAGGGGGIGRGGGMGGRGGGRGQGGTPGSLGRGGANPGGPGSIPPLTATLRWTGALPIQQALLKKTSSEAKSALSQEKTYYELTLYGLSSDIARMGQEHAQSGLKTTTSLVRKGKTPIRPETLEFLPDGESSNVIFRFPKENPIRLEDKEVEFVSRLGPFEFKQKFLLKDMVYGGRLAL